MDSQLLDVLSIWTLWPLALVLALVFLEVGYRLGVWQRAADEKEGPVGTMVASILGLLAMILAFTFNLAASRFEARRQVILEEANAIGTTYLRAKLLPDPQQAAICQLLHNYAEVRIRGVNEHQPLVAVQQSEVLHGHLWQRATQVAEQHPTSLPVALFIESLNELIDLHAKRVLVGVHSRIPTSLWCAVLGLAGIGMLATGYLAGLSATHRSPAMVFLAAAFASVLFLIADLDRPDQGTLRVSQSAMVDVLRSMSPPAP